MLVQRIVLNMKTHENADPNNQSPQVDFCWDPSTYNKIVVTPDVYNNKTSQQAWRAGFRRGSKDGFR